MSLRNTSILYLSFFFILFVACEPPAKESLVQYVDPMIGTDAHGHTFPGATVPFGMVQLSPSNDFKNWDWCSGYHYSDSVLKGFAHNHISGPGLSGLGDILLMPTSKLLTNPGTEKDPESGYRSRFSHETEKPEAGYYTVRLDDEAIKVELTTTDRVGFHRYTFETAGRKFVIIDPTHSVAEFAWETEVEILSDRQIRGHKKSRSGTAGERVVYFLATFSKPFKNAGLTQFDKKIDESTKVGERVKGYASFDIKEGESIEVQVSLSYVSYDGAKLNWEKEGRGKIFDQALKSAQSKWNDVLNRIVIEENDVAKKRIFYTSVYHSFISPNLISDVDGKYFVEGKIRESSIPQYSNFSTWDTYRALHPLHSIIEQNRTSEVINSMVSRHSEEGLILPGWEAVGYDNVCMIGYNMTSPIADAVLKDIAGIDQEKAYAAIKAASFDKTKSSPNYDVNGMDGYLKYGYVTGEIGSSVSKTTEQNYYDWAIARVAEKLGKKADADLFDLRSKGWRNLYDEKSGYLYPKMSNGDLIEMDTTTWRDLRSNYVSGNIWAYSAYTPHDMKAAIQLQGGRSAYADWLEKVFTNNDAVGGEQHVDISGFIGKYGHGDEPGHQMPYLFAVAGRPWKTQEYVNEVLTTMYNDQPDGLINNEDLGQMSAWYIFSSLGFYPLAPGDLVYQLGAPFYSKAVLNLENGNSFTVLANNQSDKNSYVQEVKLNGQPYDKTFISHEDIMKGGTIVFTMGAEPNTSWGTSPESSFLGAFDENEKPVVPVTAVSAPFDKNPNYYFEGETTVNLSSKTEGAKIYYTLDGSAPSSSSALFTQSFQLTAGATLKAIAEKDQLESSIVYEKQFFESFLLNLKPGYPKIIVEEKNTPYGEPDCSMMFDQQIGSKTYSDGKWTGLKDDFVITLDLGQKKSIKKVSIGALTDTGVWIFPPDQIEVLTGNNLNKLKSVAKEDYPELEGDDKKVVRYEFELDGKSRRYLKIIIKNYGQAPYWHGAGKGQKMWLFVDEIILS